MEPSEPKDCSNPHHSTLMNIDEIVHIQQLGYRGLPQHFLQKRQILGLNDQNW